MSFTDEPFYMRDYHCYLKIIKTLVEKIKQNTDEIYNMENYDEFTQIVEIKNLMEFHSITKEENLVIGFPTKIKELKNLNSY